MNAKAILKCALCGWAFTETDAHERFVSVAEHMKGAHQMAIPAEVKRFAADKALWAATVDLQARRVGRAQWN